jgi:glycosyltransferase involved in cell wall biosynthesis
MLAFFRCAVSIGRDRPSVIHIHNMPNFLIFAALVPRLFGTKVILDIHDTMIETYATKFSGLSSKVIGAVLGLEESVCCRLADRVVCVNSTQRQALVDRGVPGDKLTVLMNLPDPKKFQFSPCREQKSATDGMKVVYFGTISRRLGVDLAIQAVHEIRAEAPGLQFYIFGNGEDRTECSRLSARLGLGQIVHFSDDVVPLDELIALVRKMDLVVVPNRRSAATELMLPVKMLEGMALGLPVVAPRLKTIERYFDAADVFYFEPDDVRSLSGAILEAYQDRSGRERKVEKAKQFFEKYAWEAHKMDLVGLYGALTASDNQDSRRLSHDSGGANRSRLLGTESPSKSGSEQAMPRVDGR